MNRTPSLPCRTHSFKAPHKEKTLIIIWSGNYSAVRKRPEPPEGLGPGKQAQSTFPACCPSALPRHRQPRLRAARGGQQDLGPQRTAHLGHCAAIAENQSLRMGESWGARVRCLD